MKHININRIIKSSIAAILIGLCSLDGQYFKLHTYQIALSQRPMSSDSLVLKGTPGSSFYQSGSRDTLILKGGLWNIASAFYSKPPSIIPILADTIFNDGMPVIARAIATDINGVASADLYIQLGGSATVFDTDNSAFVIGNGTASGSESDALVVYSSGNATLGGDLTVTGNDIAFGNGETISNATDGTVLINGTVAGGTGSAAGVFQSNGDHDLTLQTGNSTTGSITITDGANGDITLAPNGSGKTDFNDNAITGYGADLQSLAADVTSKTLAASDNGTMIVCSSSSAITITVPASLPTGFNCMIIQSGSGQVSLSASSTTLNNRNGSKTAGQYAILTLVHLGSNVFVVSGDTTS